MLRLHFYSNHAKRLLRLATILEDEDECDVYRIDQIKEFEDVSQDDKDIVAALFEQGSFVSDD